MAINFPSSPSNGDTYSFGGKTWTYDGTAGKWEPTDFVSSITASAAELNILDGATLSTGELNTLTGITATVTELNHVDGVTSNVQTQMDTKAPVASPTFTGTATAPTVNASTALQIGGVAVTATAAELNILSGVTADATELNLLDGVTATTAEINHLDGVTSAIQTQIDNVGGGEVQVWAYVTMSGSTPTLQNDVGVSSISDQGTGTFRVNMSVTRTSQYYALAGSAWSDEFAQMRPEATNPTTRFWVYWINDAGSLTDPNFSWSVMSAGEN